mgnify:FL=1|jgi:hypothetical protein|tara:strand:+ start:960 stop:1331 length:372 start_codon:yes stop_codon:yes gene_type:complete
MPKLNVVASIIDKVADKIDDFTLDKAEKAELIQEINKAQLEVNKVEAGHTSLFVAGWRPFVGWTCGIALCYHFVLQPFLVFLLYSFGYQVALPQFDMTTLTTILMGMLGLGGLRSYEKVKKSA